MTAPDRWAPDDQLIAAVCCGNGSRTLSDLCDADRSWVIAGLILQGMNGPDIADRLSCSLRTVNKIKAADMTQVCLLLQQESLHFGQQMALADSDARMLRRDLADAIAERDRLKCQLDRVIDARMTGQQVDLCGQGHLMVDHNVYWHDGRRWCRECHADRQRDYRLAKKLGVSGAQVREARRAGLLDDLIASVLVARSTIDVPHAASG